MNKRLIAFSLLCSLFLGGTMPVYAETATVPSSATFNIDEPNPNTEFPLILGGGLVVELPAELPLVEQDDGTYGCTAKVGVRGEIAPYATVAVGIQKFPRYIATESTTNIGNINMNIAWSDTESFTVDLGLENNVADAPIVDFDSSLTDAQKKFTFSSWNSTEVADAKFTEFKIFDDNAEGYYGGGELVNRWDIVKDTNASFETEILFFVDVEYFNTYNHKYHFSYSFDANDTYRDMYTNGAVTQIVPSAAVSGEIYASGSNGGLLQFEGTSDSTVNYLSWGPLNFVEVTTTNMADLKTPLMGLNALEVVAIDEIGTDGGINCNITFPTDEDGNALFADTGLLTGNAFAFIKNITSNNKFEYVPYIVFNGNSEDWIDSANQYTFSYRYYTPDGDYYDGWNFANAANTVTVFCTDGVWVCEPDMTPVFYEN